MPEGGQSGRQLKKERQEAFLKAFVECGVIGKACQIAGIARSLHYKWVEKDKRFAQAFSDLREDYIEKLEAEADRRAVEGTLKPVFYEGEECGHIKEYSDTLLIFRLKSLRPEKYRDNFDVHHRGSLGIIREVITNVDDD